MRAMSERKLWTPQEDSLIVRLVEAHGCNTWTKVAAGMRETCPKHPRSSKQIRERWHNYLAPTINKAQWTPSEETALFAAQRELGCKWKAIAARLNSNEGCRTDNAVKNHFYSTIRRALRRMNKYFGFKNSTREMRMLKPAVLSQLVQSSVFVQSLLFFNLFKPTKSAGCEVDEGRVAQLHMLKSHYESVIFHVGTQKEEGSLNRSEEEGERTEYTAVNVDQESYFEVEVKQNWFGQDEPQLEPYVFADI